MNRVRILLVGAMLAAATLVAVAPAAAGSSSTSWDYSTGLFGLTPPSETEIAALTHVDAPGAECTVYVETNNGESTHQGNNLNVHLNGSEVLALDNFEAVAFDTMSDNAGFVSTGSDDFIVYIETTVGPITSSAGLLRVTCDPPPPPPSGGEGCTPGYWKQPHHFDSWVGYAPGDSFDAVFGVDSDFETLLDAAWARGGKDNALARHAVAALLNSSASGVSYEYSTAEVISYVQDAYASGNFNTFKNMLAEQNEQGCPLN